MQKNFTVLKVGAFQEAAKQLAEATETINAVHAKLLESKKRNWKCRISPILPRL